VIVHLPSLSNRVAFSPRSAEPDGKPTVTAVLHERLSRGHGNRAASADAVRNVLSDRAFLRRLQEMPVPNYYLVGAVPEIDWTGS
jgi:hypothetical protein